MLTGALRASIVVVIISDLCRTQVNKRLAVITGVPLLVYLNCLIWAIKTHWIYWLCLVLITVGSLAIYMRFIRKVTGLLLFITTVCITSTAWMGWCIENGNAVYGLYYSLTGFFAISGMIFWLNYKRFSAGVIISTLSFIAWAAVFPTAFFMKKMHPEIVIPEEVWNIPKFFVAIGMLLTLMEDESIKVHKAATNYKSLFDYNVAAVYRSTFDGRLLECNPAFLKMYGYSSREEALAIDIPNLYPSHEHRLRLIHDLREQGNLNNYEIEQKKKDGTRFWISLSVTIIGDGLQAVMSGTAIDISPQKEIATALRLSEARFSTFFRKSPIPCSITRLDNGAFIDVNDAFLEFVDKTKEEVIGKTAVEVGFWKGTHGRDNFLEKIRVHGFVKNLNRKLFDSKGQCREGLFSAELANVNGVECIIGMMVDVTNQKHLENQLQTAQKLEAVGRLAGGIAHDFNNILGIIGGYVELLANKTSADKKLSNYSNNILDAVKRGAGLTHQLLTFSKNQKSDKTVFAIDPVLQQMVNLLQPVLGKDIILSIKAESGMKIKMEQSQFEQVILNLAVNAKDAMPKGGHLFISTSYGPSNYEIGAPNCIKLMVSDTGIGMDESTKDKIFEPFFTTKDVGKGTGLGLATVYGIAQQCDWKIEVKSEIGLGTQFTMFIPVTTATEDESVMQKGTIKDTSNLNLGTILIVEDEHQLRDAVSEYLSELGYRVLVASNGKEALMTAKSAADELKLVITDVVMPEMNGWDFVQELKKDYYNFKYLFVSGYANDTILQHGVQAAGVPFLHKPYSFAKLAAVVREMMCLEGSPADH